MMIMMTPQIKMTIMLDEVAMISMMITVMTPQIKMTIFMIDDITHENGIPFTQMMTVMTIMFMMVDGVTDE